MDGFPNNRKQTPILSEVGFCVLDNAELQLRLVGLSGLEPLTSPLSGVRSSQLSYRPNKILVFAELVELVGIEPATS